MTYAEAYRQIVDRVNAGRGDAFTYREQGVLSKWTDPELDDRTAILDKLVLTLQIGKAGKRQPVRKGGETTADDVANAVQQIVEYFKQPVLTH